MIGDVRIPIPPTPDGYATFIKCKNLPAYRVEGREVLTDGVSYAQVFGGEEPTVNVTGSAPHLMPFQSLIVQRALERRRYAIFADCGLGKTPMGLAWAHHVATEGKVLILAPLAVYEQWKREARRFHGTELTDLRAGDRWDDGLAILNWESRRRLDMRGVAGVVLDESSILKNATGETAEWLTDIVAGVPYRLAASATPAPNSHYEYASHARWLGYASTVKEFASRFFKKDGTRWVLRGHAITPFYRALSHWATYIHSPRALGFEQSTEMPDEPAYVFDKVQVHDGYRSSSGELFGSAACGSDRPAVFGAIRSSPGPRLDHIADYAAGKRLIVWANRNSEEAAIARSLPGSSVVINGHMPVEQRVELVDAYRAGEIDHIVSKPKVLGFGVNLPECDHMVYSGFNYSFEEFYQAVRRAHRYGRRGRLEVMIPYTDPESPILSSLRAKMLRFDGDVEEMQRRFWSDA